MKKQHDGKPRYGLLPPRGLLLVTRAMEDGARKYGDTNYLTAENAPTVEEHAEAIVRHWVKLQGGEKFDPVSGLHHLAHMGARALMALELYYREAPIPYLERITDPKAEP